MSYSIEELEQLIDGFEVKLEEIGAASSAHIDEMPDPGEFDSSDPAHLAELDAWEEKRYWYQEMRNGLRERREVLVDMLAEAQAARFEQDTDDASEAAEETHEEILEEYTRRGGKFDSDGEVADYDFFDEVAADLGL